MMGPRQQLLDGLREYAYEYRAEPFTLKSGRKSNHYVDCRRVTLDRRYVSSIGSLFKSIIDLEAGSIDAVAGVVVGACPIVAATCAASDWNWHSIYVRPEAKEHGKKKQVECGWQIQQRLAERNTAGRGSPKIVLVEDVVTTGGSTLGALAALQQEGFDIQGVIALVDREEGGRENLFEQGYELRSIFTLKDFQKSP
jgi:orotate phosphoribosyltransferase